MPPRRTTSSSVGISRLGTLKNGCVTTTFWTPSLRASFTSATISGGERWQVPRMALCSATSLRTSLTSGLSLPWVGGAQAASPAAPALRGAVPAGPAVHLGVVAGVDGRHPDLFAAEPQGGLDGGRVDVSDVRVEHDAPEHADP